MMPLVDWTFSKLEEMEACPRYTVVAGLVKMFAAYDSQTDIRICESDNWQVCKKACLEMAAYEGGEL